MKKRATKNFPKKGMRNKKEIWQRIALIITGASIGAFINLITRSLDQSCNNKLLIFFFIVIILSASYGAGFIDLLWKYLLLWRRKGHKFPYLPIKIGILNDMGWSSQYEEYDKYTAGTNISPKEWLNEVCKQSHNIDLDIVLELVECKQNFDSYAAIINPYGGVYPESEVITLETLDKIFDYVSKGGLFVNTADVPGYWLYDFHLKRRAVAGTSIEFPERRPDGSIVFNTFNLINNAPFMARLGLNRNVVSPNFKGSFDFQESYFQNNKDLCEKIKKLEVNRAIDVGGALKMSNITPILVKKQNNRYLLPLFFVKYGEGDFLISLFWLSNEGNTIIDNKVVKEIVALQIISLLKNKSN